MDAIGDDEYIVRIPGILDTKGRGPAVMKLREMPLRPLTDGSKVDSTTIEVINALTGLDPKQSGCEYPNCQEDSVSSCDVCDVYFCPDHGAKRQRILTIWGRGMRLYAGNADGGMPMEMNRNLASR